VLLQELLEKERGERRLSEEELKRQMGEEQRLLIHEGESMMVELRADETANHTIQNSTKT
jgi:hypothetical protein